MIQPLDFFDEKDFDPTLKTDIIAKLKVRRDALDNYPNTTQLLVSWAQQTKVRLTDADFTNLSQP